MTPDAADLDHMAPVDRGPEAVAQDGLDRRIQILFEKQRLLGRMTETDDRIDGAGLVLHAHQGGVVGVDLAPVGLGVGILDEPFDAATLATAWVVETDDAGRQGPPRAGGRRVVRGGDPE